MTANKIRTEPAGYAEWLACSESTEKLELNIALLAMAKKLSDASSAEAKVAGNKIKDLKEIAGELEKEIKNLRKYNELTNNFVNELRNMRDAKLRKDSAMLNSTKSKIEDLKTKIEEQSASYKKADELVAKAYGAVFGSSYKIENEYIDEFYQAIEDSKHMIVNSAYSTVFDKATKILAGLLEKRRHTVYYMLNPKSALKEMVRNNTAYLLRKRGETETARPFKSYVEAALRDSGKDTNRSDSAVQVVSEQEVRGIKLEILSSVESSIRNLTEHGAVEYN
ncbi:MAG: hypothetical protein ACP5T3_02520 [Candidatus Micrarchaeia archaeon]